MDVPVIVEWLVNASFAIAVVFLLLTGVLVPGWVYRKEVGAHEKTRDALNLERVRNHDLQQIATTGTQAISALARVAEEQRRFRHGNSGGQPVLSEEGSP